MQPALRTILCIVVTPSMAALPGCEHSPRTPGRGESWPPTDDGDPDFPGGEVPGTDGDTSGSSGDDSSGGGAGPGGESGDWRLDVGDDGDGESGDPGDGAGECPCVNVRDGIYVLNSNAPPSVWFYDPPANTFTEIGPIGCEAPIGSVANSMAIDRQGNAYFNFYDTGLLSSTGYMYRAPLSDLGDCQDLGYTGGDGSWYLLGMGFATRGASDCDDLYLYNSDKYNDYPAFPSMDSELGVWDHATADKRVLGPTNYPVSELTGTGNGKLFGFATVGTNRSVLVEFDKTNATEIDSTPLDDLDITSGFAFGFWGGDVYFFTQVSTGTSNSKVTRLDHDGNDGGGLTVVNPDTGLHITGAGVSTCASFVPPG